MVKDLSDDYIWGGLRRGGVFGSSDGIRNCSSGPANARQPGEGAVVNAVAPDGVVEGVEHPGYRFALGVQWHPEYDFETDAVSAALFAAFGAATRGRGVGEKLAAD